MGPQRPRRARLAAARSAARGDPDGYCLGAQLARVEMAEALPILAQRLPDLELDGEGDYRADIAGFTGPERLPIRFVPTAS